MSTDPLYGPALLIFSMAQLWVQKNLAWGLFVGSGPGYVTKLVWNEKAFAAWGLKKKKKEKKKTHHKKATVNPEQTLPENQAKIN